MRCKTIGAELLASYLFKRIVSYSEYASVFQFSVITVIGLWCKLYTTLLTSTWKVPSSSQEVRFCQHIRDSLWWKCRQKVIARCLRSRSERKFSSVERRLECTSLGQQRPTTLRPRYDWTRQSIPTNQTALDLCRCCRSTVQHQHTSHFTIDCLLVLVVNFIC